MFILLPLMDPDASSRQLSASIRWGRPFTSFARSCSSSVQTLGTVVRVNECVGAWPPEILRTSFALVDLARCQEARAIEVVGCPEAGPPQGCEC